MAAKNCVLGLILSSFQYLRSAMVRFPFKWRMDKKCIFKDTKIYCNIIICWLYMVKWISIYVFAICKCINIKYQNFLHKLLFGSLAHLYATAPSTQTDIRSLRHVSEAPPALPGLALALTGERRCQWDFSEMSVRCQSDVSEMSVRCQWDVSEMSVRFKWDVSEMSVRCQWDVSEI